MNRENVIVYQTEMGILKNMLTSGAIDEEDYLKAEEHLSKKHNITDKSIYRLNNLICTQKYGMYIGDGKEKNNGRIHGNRSEKEVTKIT